jgi:hypothetical protein
MNKTQRIYLNTGTTISDSYIKVKLEQDVDTLEFLTLNLSSSDLYNSFNADYGVLVGRVLANNGVGVANAKISIFIPLDSTDAINPDILSIYPYTTPRDKNNDGKRYNLLPRVSKLGQDGVARPKQAFGSFPIKEELLTNATYLEVYKKYYKYTALTNSSGDYMIYGVPIGTQTVHMSVDITDVGQYSMSAASMITDLGLSSNLFSSDGKLKSSSDLDDLPNIETQEITVEIIPFWGDSSTFDIGITRQDFRIRATLRNTFIIFGSVFTDGNDSYWGSDDATITDLYNLSGSGQDEYNNLNINTKRIGPITETIYYYPNTISDSDIDNGIATPDQMQILSTSEYSVYKRNGDFILILNCNRNKIITDESGNAIPVDESYNGGIYTQFRGFITVEISPNDVILGNDILRYKFKIPQYSSVLNHENDPNLGETFSSDGNAFWNLAYTDNWRNQNMIFTGGNIYSIARYNGIVGNNVITGNVGHMNNMGFLTYNSSDPGPIDYVNNLYTESGKPLNSVGLISTDNTDLISNDHWITKDFNLYLFGHEWLNFSIYFPQIQFFNDGNGGNNNNNLHEIIIDRNNVPITEMNTWSNTNFTIDNYGRYYFYDNNQNIAANDYNTKWFARSDIHMTDFINISKADIISIHNANLTNTLGKGFTSDDINLTSTYKKTTSANKGYFYEGRGDSNCIQYLFDLNLI